MPSIEKISARPVLSVKVPKDTLWPPLTSIRDREGYVSV